MSIWGIAPRGSGEVCALVMTGMSSTARSSSESRRSGPRVITVKPELPPSSRRSSATTADASKRASGTWAVMAALGARITSVAAVPGTEADTDNADKRRAAPEAGQTLI